MNYYLASGEFFPIYDPLSMWGATTYEKGASVLHMLRHVVSDSVFFEILNSYGDQYSFSNAVTPDFQAVCESIYAQDLDWYFNEWIYDWGYPRYTYQYWQKGVDSVTVVVGQEQSIGPTFVMPVDIRLGNGAGDTVVVAWIDESPETLTFVFPGASTDSFAFDPDDWVLKQARQLPGVVEEASRTRQSRGIWRLVIQPNPSAGSIHLAVFAPQDGSSDASGSLTIYDLAGRAVKVFSLTQCGPGGETTDGTFRYDLAWDGRDETGSEVASGVYICLLDVDSVAPPEKLILLR
jgi:aminopeptidase N